MITRLAGLLATRLHPRTLWPTPADYRLARELLVTLRAPTEAMLTTLSAIEREAALTCWQRMIDRALAEDNAP